MKRSAQATQEELIAVWIKIHITLLLNMINSLYKKYKNNAYISLFLINYTGNEPLLDSPFLKI